jgi:hypothetical protein
VFGQHDDIGVHELEKAVNAGVASEQPYKLPDLLTQLCLVP